LTLAIAALALAALGHPLAQTRAADTVVAITGATILTVTQGTLPNATIVLRGGKIAAVGANVSIPAGADVVDAAGKFVSPGIVDCHSHIAADSINEGGTTVSSMTGIEDVLDPADEDIYRDLAGGLTVANVLHGSANPIGGKNQVIKRRRCGRAGRDAAPLSGHAHGRRVRDPGRVHARESLSGGVEGI
jgi:imidazolonepropionase-like amidohydrolase